MREAREDAARKEQELLAGVTVEGLLSDIFGDVAAPGGRTWLDSATSTPEEPAEPKEEIPAEPEEEIPEEIEEDIPEEPEVYVTVFAGAFRRPEQGTRKGIDRTIGRTAPKRDGKREIGRGKTAPEPNKMRRRLKREP
jgi:hypothetical protein